MSKQISAVEWYENRIFILQIQLEKKEISLGEYSVTRVELFKQAKEMEKEQIIEAHSDGRKRQIENSEQYYNETLNQNRMKTAVEQLEKEIYKWLDGRVYIPASFFEQAKAMEKEQIVNAYNDCEWTGDHEDGEQYYKQTYESNVRI
jgi:hypothetical protein